MSKKTEMCQTLEDGNKCYKSFGDPVANLVCLDEENAISIESYCGSNNTSPNKETNFTSELCPENAISKTAYHQCYNTFHLKREK